MISWVPWLAGATILIHWLGSDETIKMEHPGITIQQGIKVRDTESCLLGDHLLSKGKVAPPASPLLVKALEMSMNGQ